MNSLYVLRTERRDGIADLGKVRLQAVPAALTAVTGLLVSAERRRRVELVERVGPHHSGAQLVGHGEDQRALLGPDAGRQTVRRVVRLLDGLVRGPEGEYRQDGAEDLLAGDAVRLGHAGEDGRREPVPLG